MSVLIIEKFISIFLVVIVLIIFALNESLIVRYYEVESNKIKDKVKQMILGYGITILEGQNEAIAIIDMYLQYEFDLILSGHAHGGQWRIPRILNGFLAPNQGFFPKYAGGKYDFNHTTFIVSRGLAKESTRIPRIFNPPELVIVDILPAS